MLSRNQQTRRLLISCAMTNHKLYLDDFVELFISSERFHCKETMIVAVNNARSFLWIKKNLNYDDRFESFEPIIHQAWNFSSNDGWKLLPWLDCGTSVGKQLTAMLEYHHRVNFYSSFLHHSTDTMRMSSRSELLSFILWSRKIPWLAELKAR